VTDEPLLPLLLFLQPGAISIDPARILRIIRYFIAVIFMVEEVTKLG